MRQRKMDGLKLALTFGYLLAPLHAQTEFKSCADLYRDNNLRTNGTYTIYNNQHQAISVYCQFHNGFGYTYISPHTTVHIDIQNTFTDHSHVLIRDLRTDGTQYEARVSQMSAHADIALSIQYNAYTGYQTPINIKMAPYLYVGFLPASVAQSRGARQGYNVNGQDVLFTNCDGNGNSYIVFMFNPHNVAETGYSNNSPMLHTWVDSAYLLPRGSNLPAEYFSFFENHFGGCGGFGTPKEYPKVTGAALGLKYVITCPEPQIPTNGVKSGGGTAVGNVARFTCDPGYQMTSGDAVRRCLNTGQYSDIQPVCQTVTQCASKPCQNGAMCINVGSRYACECQPGFVGVNCETAATQN